MYVQSKQFTQALISFTTALLVMLVTLIKSGLSPDLPGRVCLCIDHSVGASRVKTHCLTLKGGGTAETEKSKEESFLSLVVNNRKEG